MGRGEIFGSVASLISTSTDSSLESIDESSEGALFYAYSDCILAYKILYYKIIDYEALCPDLVQERLKKLADQINRLYLKCLKFLSKEDYDHYYNLCKITIGSIAPIKPVVALVASCVASRGQLPPPPCLMPPQRARSC